METYNVIAHVACEKDSRTGHVVRFSDMTEWDPLVDSLERLGAGQVVSAHGSASVTGQQSVASDLVFCEGASSRLHHAQDAGLCRSVVHLLLPTEKGANGSDTDD